MNLYHVTRTDNPDCWDIWLGFIVAAPDEQTARGTFPSGEDRHWDSHYKDGWVPRDQLHTLNVEMIGVTHKDAGVILDDYKAG